MNNKVNSILQENLKILRRREKDNATLGLNPSPIPLADAFDLCGSDEELVEAFRRRCLEKEIIVRDMIIVAYRINLLQMDNSNLPASLKDVSRRMRVAEGTISNVHSICSRKLGIKAYETIAQLCGLRKRFRARVDVAFAESWAHELEWQRREIAKKTESDNVVYVAFAKKKMKEERNALTSSAQVSAVSSTETRNERDADTTKSPQNVFDDANSNAPATAEEKLLRGINMGGASTPATAASIDAAPSPAPGMNGPGANDSATPDSDALDPEPTPAQIEEARKFLSGGGQKKSHRALPKRDVTPPMTGVGGEGVEEYELEKESPVEIEDEGGEPRVVLVRGKESKLRRFELLFEGCREPGSRLVPFWKRGEGVNERGGKGRGGSEGVKSVIIAVVPDVAGVEEAAGAGVAETVSGEEAVRDDGQQLAEVGARGSGAEVCGAGAGGAEDGGGDEGGGEGGGDGGGEDGAVAGGEGRKPAVSLGEVNVIEVDENYSEGDLGT